jgi:predicted DNA-binding WGR domain protein
MGCTKSEAFDTIEEIEKNIERLLDLRKKHGYIDKSVRVAVV